MRQKPLCTGRAKTLRKRRLLAFRIPQGVDGDLLAHDRPERRQDGRKGRLPDLLQMRQIGRRKEPDRQIGVGGAP